MKLTLGGSILVVSLICGAAFSPEAIAGQGTRVRTGPQGNQVTTDWTRGNGQGTRVRTGPRGNQVTTDWTRANYTVL